MQGLSFIVDGAYENFRIDKFIVDKIPQKSRTFIVKLISDLLVKVNNKFVNKSYKVKINDEVSVCIPEAKEIKVAPQDIKLDVVYEDMDILVINKPKNMVVHPAPGNYDNTLVNALLFYCKDSLSGINGKIRPGIVHRIDKNTTGLLVIAKNDFSHLKLSEQIKEHSFSREYEAVVHGRVAFEEGIINKPISRSPIDRKKMAVCNFGNGKHAITRYKVIKRYKNFTHLRLKLETGRTHQIRVHLSSIGHPILGDVTYGSNIKKMSIDLQGQCLHARLLGIVHPRTKEYMEFESELPQYFKNVISYLENVN